MFPAPNSISTSLSPTTIVIGHNKPDMKQFAIEFGTYVQAHEHPLHPNTIDSHAVGAIALQPSNSNNGWEFLLLYSGKKITIYGWTILPISKEVIDRVS